MAKKQIQPKNNSKNSTQKYLDIESIQDSVVILKTGGLRAVLMCSSINFDLKANEEQDSIIYAYQGFLNSIDYPVQIQVTSRVLNISGYLNYLKEFEENQSNSLLRAQTIEYAQFVKDMVEGSNIVNKIFYIIIPFEPIEKPEGLLDKISLGFSPKLEGLVYTKEDFEKYKTQLWQRVNNIMYGLKRSGIYMTPLNTQELIELFYSIYNPDSIPVESLSSLESLDIT